MEGTRPVPDIDIPALAEMGISMIPTQVSSGPNKVGYNVLKVYEFNDAQISRCLNIK